MSIYDTILHTSQQGADNQMMLNRLRLDPTITPLGAMIGTQGELQKQELAKQNADVMRAYKMGYLEDLASRRKEQFYKNVLPKVTPETRESTVAAARAGGFSPEEAESIIPKQQFTSVPQPGTPGQTVGDIGGNPVMTPGIPGGTTQVPIPGSGMGEEALMSRVKQEGLRSLIESRQARAQYQQQLIDLKEHAQQTVDDLTSHRISKMDFDAKMNGIRAQAASLQAGAAMLKAQKYQPGGSLFEYQSPDDEMGGDITPPEAKITAKGYDLAIKKNAADMKAWKDGGRKGPAPTLNEALEAMRRPAAPVAAAPTPAAPVAPATPAATGGIKVGDPSPKADGVYQVGTQKLTVQGGKVTKAE